MENTYLKGKNIHLRTPVISDAEFLYKWENNTSIWQVSDRNTALSQGEIEEFIQGNHHDLYSEKQLRFIICLNNETHDAVGCVDLFDYNETYRRAGIGILIGDEENREKGYAVESLELLIKYSFDILNMHQLYCTIHATNKASINLFKKLKFQITGIKKEWIHDGNIWIDEYFLQYINN